MILTIDVGNTNVVLGCVEDGVVVSRSRLATNTSDLPNDYAMKMRQSFAFDSIDYHEFEGAILSSVVPQVNRASSIWERQRPSLPWIRTARI